MRQKHGLMSPIIDYSNKLPYVESNSSNKYQHMNKDNQENFIQRSKRTSSTKTDQPKMDVHDSFSDNTNLNEPMINIDVSIDTILLQNNSLMNILAIE